MLKNLLFSGASSNSINLVQFSKLVASDGAVDDRFGCSVSISGDGGSVAIGAWSDDDKGTDSGSAYIFTRQENGRYTQTTKLVASDGAAGDYFGYAVSISSDGGSVVIGAYNKGSKGAAYVFTRQENGQYTQKQKLTASDGAANDYFGTSASISGDGGSVVIGAYKDDDKGGDSGSAYIYTRQENGQYTETQKLLASDGAAGDWFGYSVSISGDGGVVVIGAYGDDDKSSGSGSAYLFTRQENGQYTQTQKLLASDGAANDYFGYAVSISSDGGSVVIGAYYNDNVRGSAYIFNRQGNGQYTQTQKMIASDGAASDRFGWVVAVSGDGGSIVIGAYNKGIGAGSAYIYTRQENGQYTQKQKLTASDGAANDYFGYSVAITGDGGSVVIGAYKDDDKGGDSGSAYIYTRQENGQYTETQKLLASDGAAGDSFGWAVAISGDGGTIAIGAFQDDDKGTDSGSAYIFK